MHPHRPADDIPEEIDGEDGETITLTPVPPVPLEAISSLTLETNHGDLEFTAEKTVSYS